MYTYINNLTYIEPVMSLVVEIWGNSLFMIMFYDGNSPVKGLLD